MNGFDAPVDVYLGYQSTAINPAEIYLFTESGNIQELFANGLTPWRKNSAEAITRCSSFQL
ncbi:hypothetical protein [Bathymodiolus japonicus methanotrophic gill symbiont]|uniref:hypothetical protein n=1 Tax=Bathymodiolus japonicus methanotrophic gill symbiont TaxID=113269 RepID=UPI001C8E4E0D|nr:hypothetical protein [Bathymodiolus japonicus methanotrophic gill symbiont]